MASRGRRGGEPHVDPAACGRELHGVRQQVPNHLLQAVGVTRDGAAATAASMRTSSVTPFALGRLADDVDEASITAHRSTDAGLELQLAGDDARDVEHVLDQARLGPRVPLEARERALDDLRVPRRHAQNLQPAEDGVERRAQLVRERREELVLLAVGRPQFLVAPLDAADHVVEGVDQLADLVVAVLLRAHRVVAPPRDVGRRA